MLLQGVQFTIRATKFNGKGPINQQCMYVVSDIVQAVNHNKTQPYQISQSAMDHMPEDLKVSSVFKAKPKVQLEGGQTQTTKETFVGTLPVLQRVVAYCVNEWKGKAGSKVEKLQLDKVSGQQCFLETVSTFANRTL